MTDRRRDAAAIAFLAACAALLLLPRGLDAGLHQDDHGFHLALSQAPWSEIWERFLRYVPGRNLYILFYAGLYRLLGTDPSRLHAAGIFLDGLNAALLYLLARQLGARVRLALPVAALFLVWPNHAETHFWTSAVAMNLLSTTFLLGAFLAAGCARLGPRGRPAAALLLYALALFDYDQAFFMWVPLAFHAWRAAPAGPPAGLRVFLAACLSMNAVHALLRAFAPVSEGGRPVFSPWTLPRSAAKILFENVVPLRWLPAWSELGSAAGGPAATTALLLALGAALWAVARRDEEPLAPGAWRWAALGLLWAACAYLPNLFWFVSPRHNYLPSAGLLLAAAVLWRLRWGARAWAPAAAAAFTVGAAALCASAARWSSAGSLLTAFREQAPAVVPARARGVYLVGAPDAVRDAPAFRHPQEHLFLLREARGAAPAAGDLALTPTRAGSFYLNREDLFGHSFQWEPLAGHSILAWRDGKILPVCRLLLALPGGGEHRVELGGIPGCVELELDAEGWLAESSLREDPAPAPAGGPRLLAAAAEASGGVLTLRLRWLAGREAFDFAALPRLVDARGKELFRAAYPPRAKHRRLWPMLDDLRPASTWKPGQEALQTWRYRFDGALPPGCRLELALFRRNPAGAWVPDAVLAFDDVSR